MHHLRLLIGLISLCLLALPLSVKSEETTAPSPAWSIAFEMEEHFRGDKLPRVIHLEVTESGAYKASYHLISDDPNVNAPHHDEGTLDEGRLSHLKDWTNILQSSDIPASETALNIGYSVSLQPGWQGTLIMQEGDNTTRVTFNSILAQGQRPLVYNQLATFTFDLKRLTLSKFGLNRKPLPKPDDAQ